MPNQVISLNELMAEAAENAMDASLQEALATAMEESPADFNQAAAQQFKAELTTRGKRLRKRKQRRAKRQARIQKRKEDKQEAKQLRKKWENAIGNQVVHPLKNFYPTSLTDLQQILKEAQQAGVKVKAVGSGHAFSDIGTTTDFLVETHGLNEILSNGILKNKGAALKDPSNINNLVEVEGGIVTEDLNRFLNKQDRTLTIVDDYNQQTIAGAISTATHGSLVGRGPMCDMVESLVLVTEGGRTLRIEPTDGITEPSKHDEPGIELIQDDDWFYAVVVSMGCMGIIYSLVLKVEADYWVHEVREYMDFEQAKKMFLEDKIYKDPAYLFIDTLVSPYKVKGKHMCVMTRRKRLPGKPDKITNKQKHRNFKSALVAGVRPFALAYARFVKNHPRLIPSMLNLSLNGMVEKSFIAKSVEALVTMDDLEFDGYATEVGFSEEQFIPALEAWFEIAEQMGDKFNIYQTSPMSLRFVKQTKAFMAPQNNRPITCMIEMPMVLGTRGGMEIMARYQESMKAFGGIAHWGLEFSNVSNTNGEIDAIYPKFGKWKAIYKELNKNGTFNNTFTKRMGL